MRIFDDDSPQKCIDLVRSQHRTPLIFTHLSVLCLTAFCACCRFFCSFWPNCFCMDFDLFFFYWSLPERLSFNFEYSIVTVYAIRMSILLFFDRFTLILCCCCCFSSTINSSYSCSLMKPISWAFNTFIWHVIQSAGKSPSVFSPYIACFFLLSQTKT